MVQLDKMHNQLKWLKSRTSEVRQTVQIGQSSQLAEVFPVVKLA